MRKFSPVIGLAVLALTVAATASPAAAAATQTLARWNMNEPVGSTVLVDSGPHGIKGTIGSGVTLNGSAHTFPYVQGGDGGLVAPQHLDLVKSPLLNPGTRDYAITIALKFTLALGNPLQKGQSGTKGGYFKIQLDNGGGRILCSFVSPTGSGSVWSLVTINDGAWHVVTCTRTATQVSVTVDGKISGTVVRTTGSISNTWPVSIGGKSMCDQHTIFCDYFTGQIDYVQIQTS
jgi:hypothetical protein